MPMEEEEEMPSATTPGGCILRLSLDGIDGAEVEDGRECEVRADCGRVSGGVAERLRASACRVVDEEKGSVGVRLEEDAML